MTAADPAARLQALAGHYRYQADDSFTLGEAAEWVAWAEHVQGVAKRHTPHQWVTFAECLHCSAEGSTVEWPCADVAELLAVADAAGVIPKPDWRCPRCGSPRWVSVSLDEGHTRRKQCVPCGRVDAELVKP